MSYIFCSNGNTYTFRKLDSMLINMPEADGRHVLVRETVDGAPQYSWTSNAALVVVNDAIIFEYTPTITEPWSNKWTFDLSAGNYLVTTTVTAYVSSDTVFDDCESIEDVVSRGYFFEVAVDGQPVLRTPHVDSLNSLVTYDNTSVLEVTGEASSHAITAESNVPDLVALRGVKSVAVVFLRLGESGSVRE